MLYYTLIFYKIRSFIHLLHEVHVVFCVLDEPVVTIGSSSVYVVEGDPLWLTCRQLDANPNITKYEWLKKGTKVKGLNASPTSLTARGEIFPKINRTDGGEFTCRGKNSAGWGESNTCHVDVYCK